MLSTPSKAICVSALALLLVSPTLALSASAQTGGSGTMTSPGSATTSPNVGTSGTESNSNGTMSSQGTDSTTDDRGFDWGWVGLLGLLGLAGLRKPERTQAYREDPNEASRSTSRL